MANGESLIWSDFKLFYYLIPTLFSYDAVLIAAAVIPAVFLMIKVYQSDHLEKETPAFLWKLAKAGIFASLIALVEERILSTILRLFIRDSFLYQVILYFGIVAVSEESSKYLMLKHHAWNSPEFNCQYDGVVYGVFVSLGFALWENISYVLSYGFQTALIRAITAIPGHACFGVFMGVFFGLARTAANRGRENASAGCRILAFLVPAFLHGMYDYIATIQAGDRYFIGFIAIMFIVSLILIGRMSRDDHYI